jgi:uncharacterized membrane protein YdbT with pleckstrin-like domain
MRIGFPIMMSISAIVASILALGMISSLEVPIWGIWVVYSAMVFSVVIPWILYIIYKLNKYTKKIIEILES